LEPVPFFLWETEGKVRRQRRLGNLKVVKG
jgi:hypothetical protein